MSNKIPTFNEWCNSKNPDQYKIGLQKLPPKTIQYWTSSCNAIKASDLNTKNFHFPPDFANELEKTGKKVGKFGQDVLDKIGQAIISLLESLQTPEGIAMFGLIIGVNVAISKTFSKILPSLAKEGLTKWMEQELLDNGVKIVEDGIAKATTANISTIFTSFIRRGLDNFIGEGIRTGGFYAASELLSGLEDVLPVIGELIELVQFIGMAFDMWDPCHLNEQLDASTLMTMNSTFGQVYRKTAMGAFDSVTDAYDNTYYNDIWPIEMYAELSFLGKIKSDCFFTHNNTIIQTLSYDNLQSILMAYYLDNLTFNSVGERICIPVGGSALTRNDLLKIDNKISEFLSDGNTVVANWLKKYLPIILLIMVILFIIILIFIFRKNK